MRESLKFSGMGFELAAQLDTQNWSTPANRKRRLVHSPLIAVTLAISRHLQPPLNSKFNTQHSTFKIHTLTNADFAVDIS